MLKLLVVDDEEFIQETMCNFFSSKGYQTYGASGGEEALSIIKKERPHLVLLDVMLAPGSFNGFEVFKKIKEIDKTIKVIIITGKATDQKSMRRGKELGVNDYLLKPLDYEKLEQEALRVLGEVPRGPRDDHLLVDVVDVVGVPGRRAVEPNQNVQFRLVRQLLVPGQALPDRTVDALRQDDRGRLRIHGALAVAVVVPRREEVND